MNCLNETIESMLKKGDAHQDVYDTRKLELPPYPDFIGDVAVPTTAWVFMTEFQRTREYTVSLISVDINFKELTDFKLILNPILEHQLG